MLSRKQRWRLAKSKYIPQPDDEANESNQCWLVYLFDYLYNKRTDTSEVISGRRKNVTFQKTIRVILIPILKEYQQNNLDTKLWYSKDDYELFKKNYNEEIKRQKYNSI